VDIGEEDDWAAEEGGRPDKKDKKKEKGERVNTERAGRRRAQPDPAPTHHSLRLLTHTHTPPSPFLSLASKKRSSAVPLPAAQRARISKMFSAAGGGAGGSAGAGVKKAGAAAAAGPVDTAAADALLDDILGGMDGGGVGAANAALAPAARPVLGPRRPPQAAAAVAASRLAAAAGVLDVKPEPTADGPEPMLEDDDGADAPPPSRGASPEEGAAATAAAAATTTTPSTHAHPAAARLLTDAAAGPSALITPPPAVPTTGLAAAAGPTPGATAATAAGWEEVAAAAAAGGGDVEITEEGGGEPATAAAGTAPASSSSSLPLAPDGSLPFFLIDAVEDAAAPGTVFLFGKVAKNVDARPSQDAAAYSSCCAVIRDCTRSVCFVLAPGTFEDGEVSDLESAAAASAASAAAASPGDAPALLAEADAARGALLGALHAAAGPAKAEIRAALAAAGVSKFTLKPVKRSYPGVGAPPGVAVPKGPQWVIKARYPAASPSLPAGLRGDHFTAAFGGNTGALESFLLKRRVKGATWLRLEGAAAVEARAQVSWCGLEVSLAGPKLVSPAPDADARPPPPLVAAAIKVTTALHPTAKTNEVAALSVVYLKSLPADRPVARSEWSTPARLRAFSIVRRLEGRPFPPGFDSAVAAVNAGPLARGVVGGPALAALPNEKALLTAALARLRELDPDVLVGHNAAAFDLDVLLHRCLALRAPHWSRLGRLKRSKPPGGMGGGGGSGGNGPGGGGASPGLAATLAGRLLCDTYLASRDLVREVDYTLATMARVLLGQARSDLPPGGVAALYEGGPDSLLRLVKHAEGDAWLALGLATHLNALPLTRALACLSGSLWSRALLGQRAGRIEMLLLHELHARKMLCPDRLSTRERERLQAAAAGPGAAVASTSKGPQYAGGLVLEPKKGLYDRYVLLLDFNSLYPSIIQEYDLCFTTVAPAPPGGGPAALPTPPSSPEDAALLPTVIRGLVQRRRVVKDLLRGERDPTRRAQLDIRQQALKLTANSMYGCLGFSHSRFFARPVAELVTLQGREVLQATVDLVQSSLGADVVYGDTDSIMVATGSADLAAALALGGRIKKEVNKRYRTLEIELDGVFARLLLLKKKKYAAVKLEAPAGGGPPAEVREAKGLDIVRRDWCPLAKDAGNFALDAILAAGAQRDDVVAAIHDKLRTVAAAVRSGEAPLHKFVITKQLTKRPTDYPDASAQPHVQVALRRGAGGGGGDGTRQGETVPYVICVDGPGAVVVEAAARSPGGDQENAAPPAATPAAAADKGKGKAAVGTPGAPPSCLLAGKPMALRAFHPDEVRASAGAITPDAEYYLGHQVHPVVARLCAPIEGTDPGALAECLGLDAGKFRSGGGSGGGAAGGAFSAAAAAAARDAAMLGGGALLDDDARFERCPGLLLPRTRPGPTTGPARTAPFAFGGAERVAAGAAGAGESFAPLDDPSAEPPTPAQVANAATLAARAAIVAYYDSAASPDDELLAAGGGGRTRDVSLRPPAGASDGGGAAGWGTAPPDPRAPSTTRMVRDLGEAEAYARVAAVWRSLDPARAVGAAVRKAALAARRPAGLPGATAGAAPLEPDEAVRRLAPVRDTLEAGAAAASTLRDACAYRWVDLSALFG